MHNKSTANKDASVSGPNADLYQKNPALARVQKTMLGKTQRPAEEGKWHRENPVSRALLVQRGLTAGKTQHSLRTQQKWQFCVLSEDRHRHCDLDLLTSKMNGFPGLIVEHLYVKFSDPSCIGCCDIVWQKQTNRQTNKQTDKLGLVITCYASLHPSN